jgi:heptosyltransferase-2
LTSRASELGRIVVFCPNLIGDTVMATPALRALRQRFPSAWIAGVVKPQVSPVLDGAPWLDERIAYDPRSKKRDERTWSVLQRLHASRFEVSLLLPNSHRSALMAWLAGIPRRIGYERVGRGLLLTDRLTDPKDEQGRRLPFPAVDSYLKLVRTLGCTVRSVRTQLFTTDADERAADLAWSRLGLPSSEPVVCLNNGGAFGPAKSWPAEHFAKLARRLAVERGVAVLMVCGPSEREAARKVVELAGHPRVVSLANESMSIGLTKACIRRSALLITTDSGPRHFAGPFDVPVITLFGPTHVAWTRTYHPHSIHMFHPVPCGPCQQPICPLGHQLCMRDLNPDHVFAAALRMLERSPRAKARRATVSS